MPVVTTRKQELLSVIFIIWNEVSAFGTERDDTGQFTQEKREKQRRDRRVIPRTCRLPKMSITFAFAVVVVVA